ncbi:NHL domain-containing protein [Actinidia rufa]|uniref:NHL domain-containing protein n=1 Tax=Actinidia rufa TaxID=165716 RepID=A0A7J0ERX0_9ERIC|nr:NHL domain-containing protein [Actinidia rufa]
MTPMGKNVLVLVLTLVLLFGGFSSAQATSPAKIVNGFLSNAVSILMKWLWSLKATTKTAITGRPMMKFESGYTVETVFDGNSRPKLVAGSADGYSGHIDGKPRDARMNNPKGLAVDDRGNIYIADTTNMAIRKIGDAGVTTIAGGKWGRGGGHVDGPSEDAKFSNDFDVVYIGSSCSLLVIDRGNQAIREIQLHFDDCAYQYGSGFPLGIAVLVVAGFFGYMLALLQRRVGTIVPPSDVSYLSPGLILNASINIRSSFVKFSVRPPLIPSDEEQEKQEESFFGSLGRLLVNAWASFTEIFGIIPGFRKKAPSYQYQQPQQKYSNTWPVQESFVIPDEDEPPSIETRIPTPRKTYPFMSKDAEEMQQLRQSRAFYSGWDGDLLQQKQPMQKQQHHHQYRSSAPQTYYEQSCEKTNEVVFGAVQEQDGRREAVVIKPLDHWNSIRNDRNIRSRINYMGNTYAN